MDAGRYADEEWIVAKDKERYDQIFYSLNPNNGKLSGAAAKSEMVSYSAPQVPARYLLPFLMSACPSAY